MTTTPRALRVLRNRQGDTIETTLTDQEAVQLCRRLTSNDFCQQLVQKYGASQRPGAKWGLSEAQWYWLHKYALEGPCPKPTTPTTQGEFLPIVRMYERVKRVVQNPPKIRLLLPVPGIPDSAPHDLPGGGRQPLALSYSSGATTKYPNTIAVNDGAPYGRSVFYGRIDTLGNFIRMRNCPESILTLLRLFAHDPAGVAKEHGRLNGRCCLCDNPLTDDRSIEAGYGPVCADHYGLPWGGKRNLLQEIATVPEFEDPRVQAEYDRLVRGGMDPENAAERAFDPLIKERDRVDQALADAHGLDSSFSP